MNKIEKGCHLHQLVLALLSWLYRAGKVRILRCHTVQNCRKKCKRNCKRKFHRKKKPPQMCPCNLLELFTEQIECKVVKAFLSLCVKYERKEICFSTLCIFLYNFDISNFFRSIALFLACIMHQSTNS